MRLEILVYHDQSRDCGSKEMRTFSVPVVLQAKTCGPDHPRPVPEHTDKRD